MKLTDVRSLPVTDDENTEQDLENMLQWGILPERLSDIAGKHQQDQYDAVPSYLERFTQTRTQFARNGWLENQEDGERGENH